MYFKVPKCAGTTVDVLIKNTLKSKGVKYDYSPNTICKSKNLWVVKGYTEYKIGKIIETDFWNESEKFTIVRNPFDKVLSSWLFCLKNNFYRGDFHSFVKNEYIRYKENKKWINYTSWKEELKEFYRKEFNVELDDPDETIAHIVSPLTGNPILSDIHTDLVLEGRHGNSIRIGSRNRFPNLIIDNGRGQNQSIESINDSSIFGMFDNGSILEHFKPQNETLDGEVKDYTV